ncbi:MAG TPA: tetratricopeptide repeat protein, partial [Candidatus Cloacimonadota bacterium]|nr:tetratricopeptide repeat protein [Candidatus Cloacimonadota bacterium]
MRVLLLILSISIISFGWAELNPIRDYLDQPSMQSFEQAVKHLNSIDTTESLQAELNLAYIANYEAMRLMELAMAKADELSAAERFSLANMFLGMDKYAEAIKLYEALNQASPKWSCPWRHKGEAYYKSGNFSASAQALEMAIQTNPEHYDAYIWYAKTLYQLARYEEAMTALN